MEKKQLLGFIGSGLLALGVFLPIISVPFFGTINYFNEGEGDGVIVLALAIISAVLTFKGKYNGLWGTGLASLGLMGYAFYQFNSNVTGMAAEMVKIEWGWIVLVAGAVCVIASAAMKPAAGPSAPAE